MRLLSLIPFIFALLLSSAGAAQELHLQDGTVIQGTLVSFDRGVYTFSSQTLGEIKIEESQVVALTSTTAPRLTPHVSDNQPQLEQLQAEMLGDAEVMHLIESLQNDPDVLAIMQDPAIMEAIQRGDFNSLENNPKLQKLMEKSQVKTIKKKYGN